MPPLIRTAREISLPIPPLHASYRVGGSGFATSTGRNSLAVTSSVACVAVREAGDCIVMPPSLDDLDRPAVVQTVDHPRPLLTLIESRPPPARAAGSGPAPAGPRSACNRLLPRDDSGSSLVSAASLARGRPACQALGLLGAVFALGLIASQNRACRMRSRSQPWTPCPRIRRPAPPSRRAETGANRHKPKHTRRAFMTISLNTAAGILTLLQAPLGKCCGDTAYCTPWFSHSRNKARILSGPCPLRHPKIYGTGLFDTLSTTRRPQPPPRAPTRPFYCSSCSALGGHCWTVVNVVALVRRN